MWPGFRGRDVHVRRRYGKTEPFKVNLSWNLRGLERERETLLPSRAFALGLRGAS